MADEQQDRLSAIQDTLDELYIDFVKRDFDIKLVHHKKIEQHLAERDVILKEMPRAELAEFFRKGFAGFDAVQDFLPLGADNAYDTSFIKSVRAEYLEGERMRVSIELYENAYTSNEVLEKTIYLFEREPETVKIDWKDEQRACILFDFFEVDEDSLDLFDIIYEFYVNMVAYATAE